MQTDYLTLTRADGRPLRLRLDLPSDGRAVAFALFAHCFSCRPEFEAADHIAAAMTLEGYGVVRFDYADGAPDGGHYRHSLDDLIAAAALMSAELEGPALLLGHSLAGAAVLQAAAQMPSVRAVATLAAPADPTYVRRLLRDGAGPAGGDAVEVDGHRFCVDAGFLAGLDAERMRETIHRLRRPLLILHSPLDRVIGIDNAEQIFLAAMHPKSFVSLDRADHLLSDPEDAAQAGRVIAAWAGKYLETRKQAEAEAVGEDSHTVAHTGARGYKTDLVTNGHALIADEPVTLGGSNRGPSPYDLLSAALAACTSMTIRMYADRKGWPVAGITVRVMHRKLHAKDCEDCPQGGRIDVFDRELRLTGELDAEQRARLLEIADRCPVHRTLHSEIQVNTRLTDE